jgi:hypothetical protein
VEKNGLVLQLESWFSRYGIPILALGGYSSQSYADEITEYMDGRTSVLIYAGDYDPSGLDIFRDFTSRVHFSETYHIGLNRNLIERYSLPPAPGKTTDTRAANFTREHGELVQVELDALAPDVLRGLYQGALDPFLDRSILHAVLEEEAQGQVLLEKVQL